MGVKPDHWIVKKAQLEHMIEQDPDKASRDIIAMLSSTDNSQLVNLSLIFLKKNILHKIS